MKISSILIASALALTGCASSSTTSDKTLERVPASDSKHPCAPLAGQAALQYAASAWKLAEDKQKVLFIEDMDNNPLPTKGFDVGIRRQDRHLAQFYVFFTIQNGQCQNPRVSFFETAE